MALGGSFRNYLGSGEVSVILHAEFVNWTGQAPPWLRNHVPQLAGCSDVVVSRPGGHFLLGAARFAARQVYIGEVEDVPTGLQEHVATEDFWRELHISRSGDDNLIKCDLQCLPAQAKQAGASPRRRSTRPWGRRQART